MVTVCDVSSNPRGVTTQEERESQLLPGNLLRPVWLRSLKIPLIKLAEYVQLNSSSFHVNTVYVRDICQFLSVRLIFPLSQEGFGTTRFLVAVPCTLFPFDQAPTCRFSLKQAWMRPVILIFGFPQYIPNQFKPFQKIPIESVTGHVNIHKLRKEFRWWF